MDTLEHFGGTPVLVCAPDGPALRGEGDANDFIGDAWYHGATWVAVPAERLSDDFFELRTRLAGDVVQKFVNYRIGLAVVGDVSAHVAGSEALRAFVSESNRGTQLWFVDDLGELGARLAQ